MTQTVNQISAKQYKSRIFYDSQQFALSKAERLIFNQKVMNFRDHTTIFNTFSGKGGLHNLNRNQFASYSQYAQAKQKIELGQFFTPNFICQTIIEMLEIEHNSIVADICSGKGSFFNYLKGCCLYGVEKDKQAYSISKKLFPKANIQNIDMRQIKDLPVCDYIVGNPPFDLPFYNLFGHPLNINGKVLSQSFYLWKCFEFLRVGGFLGFVCPYFETPRRITANHKVKKFFWEKFNVIVAINLPKGVFRDSGTNIQTKILILQKKSISEYQSKMPFFQTTFRNREQVLKEWRNSLQYLHFHTLKKEMNLRRNYT